MRAGIAIFLAAIVWAVFGRTITYDFVNHDDPAYVTKNERVQAGLSWSNTVWAFSHVHSNNWHPLTTVSHMLDCQMFGVRPAWPHFLNVLLHTIAAILLFLLFEEMTGKLGRSAFVAAIFAIHPLRAESVAWISERKDVLSAVFFMLTLVAYVRYARRQTVGGYVAVLILFVCGLLSKPMLVTLPGVLLLLDYWPLNRLTRESVKKLVFEKIPLGVLSIASAVATMIAQSTQGMLSLKTLPVTWRISNAIAACVIYIWQMFWPANLMLGYDYPERLSISRTLLEATLLIAITVCAIVFRKRMPYLVSGWFWYLLMLLPVLGLIQVGPQAHADRYTYLPQIGLYIAISWAVADFSSAWPYRGQVLAATSAVIIILLSVRAADQVRYWQNGGTLWQHALAVEPENEIAHIGLAGFFADHEHFDDAIREYEIALRIGGANPDLETTVANLLLEHGSLEEAVRFYRDVVRQQPASALAHYNLAIGFHRAGQLEEAIVHYKEALRIEPGYPDAEKLLGQAEAAEQKH